VGLTCRVFSVILEASTLGCLFVGRSVGWNGCGGEVGISDLFGKWFQDIEASDWIFMLLRWEWTHLNSG